MKECFLISPIGKDNSEERQIADQVKSFLQYEVLGGLDYRLIRADDINKVGMINSDIIAKIISSELVIAYLDYDNANVYYELALRHATKQICISILSRERLDSKGLPFDINQERVFKFPIEEIKAYKSHPNGYLTEGLARFKTGLIDIITNYETDKYEIFNPVITAINKVILPTKMPIETVVNQLQNNLTSMNGALMTRIDELAVGMDSRMTQMETIIKNWMPDDLKSAVNDMYQNGSATYISGEEEAFKKLTEMTRTAKHSLRTSRFAPQAIGTSHSDFFNAVCEFGRKNNVTCIRIMCMNEEAKEADIVKTILDTAGGSMKLYLMDQDNNFELVVIDDTCAFLHFYDDNRFIKSTLYIRGQRVVQEFEKIYDRFLEPAPGKMMEIIDCSQYTTPADAMQVVKEITIKFKEHSIVEA